MSSHPKTSHKPKAAVKPVIHNAKPAESAPATVSQPHTQKSDKTPQSTKPLDKQAKPMQISKEKEPKTAGVVTAKKVMPASGQQSTQPLDKQAKSVQVPKEKEPKTAGVVTAKKVVPASGQQSTQPLDEHAKSVQVPKETEPKTAGVVTAKKAGLGSVQQSTKPLDEHAKSVQVPKEKELNTKIVNDQNFAGVVATNEVSRENQQAEDLVCSEESGSEESESEESESEESESEESESEVSEPEVSEPEQSASQEIEPEEPVAAKPGTITHRMESLLKKLDHSRTIPETIPKSNVAPFGPDMALLPHFPINGMPIMSLNGTYSDMGMEAGVVIYLAGSILVKLENSGHVTRIQETVVRLLTKWVRTFNKEPVSPSEVPDATPPDNEYETYYRKLETGVEERRNLQYLRMLMQVQSIKFQELAHERCVRKPSTSESYERIRIRDCMEEDVIASAKKDLHSYLTNPTVSNSIKEIMCGTPQNFLFDFFDQLFGSGDDKHICNTLITALADTNVDTVPDTRRVLDKIKSLEQDLQQISETDRAGPKFVAARTLEDNILKWQFLNMAGDMVTEFKRASMPPDASSEMVYTLPKLAMDATFRTRLRMTRNLVDTDPTLNASTPVSMRPAFCFMATILNMGDERLISVFQSFAREYYSSGGGIHKNFLNYLNGERTNAPINIIKQVQLFMQIFASSIMPGSKTTMLFSSKSQSMELYNQYYELYLDENLPTTDRSMVGTLNNPVRLYEDRESPKTTTTDLVDYHVSDAFIANSLAVATKLNRVSTGMSNFDDITSIFTGISPSIGMGLMMLHIVSMLCEVASDENDHPKCHYPVFESTDHEQKHAGPSSDALSLQNNAIEKDTTLKTEELNTRQQNDHRLDGMPANTTAVDRVARTDPKSRTGNLPTDQSIIANGNPIHVAAQIHVATQIHGATQIQPDRRLFAILGGLSHGMNNKSSMTRNLYDLIYGDSTTSTYAEQAKTTEQEELKDMTSVFILFTCVVVSGIFLRIKQKRIAQPEASTDSTENSTIPIPKQQPQPTLPPTPPPPTPTPPVQYVPVSFTWLALKQMSVSTEPKLTLFINSNGRFSETISDLRDKLNESSQHNDEDMRALNNIRGNINDVKQYICDRIRNQDRSIQENLISLLIGYIGYISTVLLFNGDIPRMHSDANRKIFDQVGSDEFESFERTVKKLYQNHNFGDSETEKQNEHLLYEAIYEKHTVSADNLRFLLKLFAIQTKKIPNLSDSNQINCAMLLRRAMCVTFGDDCGKMRMQ